MGFNIEQQIFNDGVMQPHRLADTQALVIDGDGLWEFAQPRIAFKDQHIDAIEAEQVRCRKASRASANYDNGEVGRWL